MPNLLSKDPLVTAQQSAEVYVVYNNKDYRMSLATLISLVTKQSLGLDKINNTADAEKPVSSPVATELAKKANSTDVPTREAFDALAARMSNVVTQQELNTAIQSVVTAMNSLPTMSAVNTAISQALAPINLSISSIATSLEEQIQRISNLQEASNSYANKAALQNLQEQLTVTESTLAALSESFTGHSHSAESISGLSEMVAELVASSANVIIGSTQW